MMTRYHRLKHKIIPQDPSPRNGCLLAIAVSLLFWGLIIGAFMWLG